MSVPDRSGICQSIICGHKEILFLKPISERGNCVVEGLSTQAPKQHRNKCKFGVSRSQTDDPLKQIPSARAKIDARWKMGSAIFKILNNSILFANHPIQIHLRWHYFELSEFRPEMQTFTNSGNWRV